METILVDNALGRAIRTTYNGREYLVAPATTIVPGVLNGSKGPLYYPADECLNSVSSWDGMPLVVYHPNDPLTNTPLSAQSPGVLTRQGIGFVKDSVFNGKLRHQLWFDVENTRRVDQRVLSALETGQPIELSTGLYTDNIEASPGSHHNGVAYKHTARNYRPDHIAILPDQKGACSIQDGCGVLVNKGHQMVLPEQTPMLVVNEDVKLSIWQRLGEALGITSNATPNQPRHTTSGQYLPHGAGTGAGPHHVAAKMGHSDLVLTDQDRALGNLAAAEKGALGNNPASWVEDEDTWEKAKAAADKGDYDKESGQYWAVVSHIYQNMGGTVKEGTHNTGLRAYLNRELVSPIQYLTKVLGISKEEALEIVGTQNAKITSNMDVRHVMTNCGDDMSPMGSYASSPHEASKQAASTSLMSEHGKAREHALSAMDSSKGEDSEGAVASHLKAAGAHEKAATQARKEEDERSAETHDKAAFLHRKAASIHTATMNEFVTINEGGGFESDEQREAFFGMLKGGKGGDKGKEAGGKSETAHSHTDALSKAADNRSTLAKKAGGEERQTKEHGKAAEAHTEAAKAHWSAMKATNDKGVKEGHQKAAKEHFDKAKFHKEKANPTGNRRRYMTTEQIRTLLTSNCKCDEDKTALNNLSDETLLGVYNAKVEGTNADVMGMMKDAQAGGEEDDEESDDDDFPDRAVASVKKSPKTMEKKMTENEWFASAPPSIQSAVRNAMEIEKQERMTLVHRLIANVSNDSQRKQVGGLLSRKSLNELRTLVTLLPSTQNHQRQEMFPNYMGAASPFTTNQVDNAKDDILDTPTLNFREISEEHRSRA